MSKKLGVKPALIFPYSDNDEVQTTGRQLLDLVNSVRNSVLCEVLGVVTEKLDPVGNVLEKELALIDVLRSVNDMRAPEPEETK